MRSLSLSLLLAAAMLACTDTTKPPVSAAKKTLADSADQVMFGSRTIITDRGLLRAEIESDTSFFFGENTHIVMRPARGVFFNSTGAKDAVLGSREGTYDSRLSQLTASGDVLVTSVDGRRLRTPFLRFDQRLNLISSDSSFTLTEGDRETKGVGFRADPDLNNLTVVHLISAKAGVVQVPK